MRTTLDIDDDVLAAAKELSKQRNCSAGQIISLLARQALTSRPAEDASSPNPQRATVAGFRPFTSRGSPVTNAAIDRVRDEEGV